MKKLIVFAITCLMGINVVAMEEDFSALSSEKQESFLEDLNILEALLHKSKVSID